MRKPNLQFLKKAPTAGCFLLLFETLGNTVSEFNLFISSCLHGRVEMYLKNDAELKERLVISWSFSRNGFIEFWVLVFISANKQSTLDWSCKWIAGVRWTYKEIDKSLTWDFLLKQKVLLLIVSLQGGIFTQDNTCHFNPNENPDRAEKNDSLSWTLRVLVRSRIKCTSVTVYLRGGRTRLRLHEE